MKDGLAVIRLDDGKVNAVSNEMMDELEPIFERAQAEARAICLTGRPGVFCAGFDLKSIKGDNLEVRRRLRLRGAEFSYRLFCSPRPVVAAVTGHAVALGALWLLACDLRIAAAGDCKYGLNEGAIGLDLPSFGMELARSRIDVRFLTEAVLHGRMYSAAKATEVGYLDELAEADRVDAAAEEAARRLMLLPEDAYLRNKLRLREPALANMRSAIESLR